MTDSPLEFEAYIVAYMNYPGAYPREEINVFIEIEQERSVRTGGIVPSH